MYAPFTLAEAQEMQFLYGKKSEQNSFVELKRRLFDTKLDTTMTNLRRLKSKLMIVPLD